MNAKTYRTVTTDYGIDYGKPYKSSPAAGWYVYAEHDGKPIGFHTVYETEDEAIARAEREQGSLDARRAAAKAEREAQEAPAAAPAAHAETTEAPRASDRQIALIAKLISEGKHLEGGFYQGPTTAEGIAQMTKADASAYITSLLGKY